MCTGTRLYAWQAEVVRSLIDRGLATPELLIIEDRTAAPAPSPAGRVMRLLRHQSMLWHLYEQRYVHPRTRWNSTVDMGEVLNTVPAIRARTLRKGRFSEYFSEDDLKAIRARELDFILRFAFGIIRGPVLESARYGVWSFHHGDPEKYRGGPYCFWELRRSEPRTVVVLQRLTAKLDGGIILKSGSVPTALKGLAANRDRALELGIGFPAEVCRDIQSGNAGYINGPPLAAPGKLYVAPTNLEMLGWLLRLRK
jgi:hypothetical protein